MSKAAAGGAPSIASFARGSSAVGYAVDCAYTLELAPEMTEVVARGDQLPDARPLVLRCLGNRSGPPLNADVMFDTRRLQFFDIERTAQDA